MPSTGSPEHGSAGRSVLPSFALWPVLAAGAWVAVGPFLSYAAGWQKVVLGPAPGAVVIVFSAADYVLWRRRDRPWHDWHVVLLLLPPIAAAVWVSVGALALDAGYTREELLGIAVGPGIALVGLLCTTISYHGRHHPDEWQARDSGRAAAAARNELEGLSRARSAGETGASKGPGRGGPSSP